MPGMGRLAEWAILAESGSDRFRAQVAKAAFDRLA